MNSFKLKKSFGILFIVLLTCSTIFAQDKNEIPIYKDVQKTIEDRIIDLFRD